MKLAWLPKAILERDAQLDFIARSSPRASIEQGDEIEKLTDILLEHPEMGRLGRRKGTREFVVSRTPFIIVYRFKPRARRIEVLRLLHGSQQWPKGN